MLSTVKLTELTGRRLGKYPQSLAPRWKDLDYRLDVFSFPSTSAMTTFSRPEYFQSLADNRPTVSQ